ncbi:hypothetical protein GCM10023169_33460 [Georgenia halophila]|uniref:HIT domain-containing protein n=1 Tax=Georgenia halophila TaxID=620889 RepID=A0ABP8LIA3_9MICO
MSPTTDECLVCQEHSGEVRVPGGHLVADDAVVAFHLPPWPPPAHEVYLGYLMVTSRRHVPGFADLSDEESAAVGRWIARLSRALESLGAQRVYVMAVGHGVPHLHVHLLPRWPETPEEVSWLDVGTWRSARKGDAAAASCVTDQVWDRLQAEKNPREC